jgi:hypothetical protein
MTEATRGRARKKHRHYVKIMMARIREDIRELESTAGKYQTRQVGL